MGIEMVTGSRAILNPLPFVLYPVEPKISTPKKSAFALSLGVTLTLVCQQQMKILKNKKVLLVQGLRNVSQKFQTSA